LGYGPFFAPLQEVYLSQVHYQEIPHDWEDSFQRSSAIVIARRAGDMELYKEIVFPKETHYNQNQETLYREWSLPYEVVEVIRPARGQALGPGQKIQVWLWGEYGPDDLESYHTTGIIHSPIILLKEREAEIQGDRVLLFLEPHENVWRSFNQAPEEGEGLLERLREEGTNPWAPESLFWYWEDRSWFHRDGEAIWISEEGLAVRHTLRFSDSGQIEERKVYWRIGSEDWEEAKMIIQGTLWDRLELRKILLPDETRPLLWAGGVKGGQWLIDIVEPSEESLAYQKILGLSRSQGEDIPWLEVSDDRENFQWWPQQVQGQ